MVEVRHLQSPPVGAGQGVQHMQEDQGIDPAGDGHEHPFTTSEQAVAGDEALHGLRQRLCIPQASGAS